jgi:hypothetical protein
MLRNCVWALALAILFAPALSTAYVSAHVKPLASSQNAEVAAEETVTFRVRIQNIAPESETATLFSPGAWVLHSESDPLFKIGEVDRGEGLEALAEDGDPTLLAASLRALGFQAGVFERPICADTPRPLRPLEYYEFEITVSRETPFLSFATMLVQSNDLFLAPTGSGIPLFDDEGKPIAGQFVTNRLALWDAGTEENEVLGKGAYQAPRQQSANSGPKDDDATVRPADAGLYAPAVVESVRVYVVHVPTIERNRDSLQTQASDFSIGDGFQIGDVEWRVLSAENLGHEIRSQNDKQTTSERFISLRFQFLNVGSDPLEFEAVRDLPLQDSTGRVYVHYRIQGPLRKEYPKDFINDEEHCFGRRVLGVWRPFILKPNALTTCSTIYEVQTDATNLMAIVSGLQQQVDVAPKSVGLEIPSTPRIAVGKVLQVGDVRWQVLSAEDHGHVVEGNGIKEKTTERFIKVRFQITNKGSTDLDFPGPVLRDRQGREYERKALDVVSEDEKCVGGIVGVYKLLPNVITTCAGIYEVPYDSTGLVLVADDLQGTEASTEVVSLGLSDVQPILFYLVDEDVEVGDMCWRVLSVEELGQELSNEEGDTETTEGRFVKVQFGLLNLGSGTLGYAGVTLEDRDGRKYSHFGERLEFIDDEQECPPSLIPPRTYGLKPNTPTICTSILEVSGDAEEFVLFASDLEGFETVPIAFVSVASATPPEPVPPGTYEVGSGISPGVYRGEAPEDAFCNWSRLADLSGDSESIVAMGQREGQFYVEVQDSDVGFTTECELIDIEYLELREPPLNSVPPGMYIVGLDILPGEYEGDPGEGLFCFWQRMRDFREEEASTIEWDIPGEKFSVEIVPSDYAVEFSCPMQKVE